MRHGPVRPRASGLDLARGPLMGLTGVGALVGARPQVFEVLESVGVVDVFGRNRFDNVADRPAARA